jgi:hypothetical protein
LQLLSFLAHAMLVLLVLAGPLSVRDVACMHGRAHCCILED